MNDLMRKDTVASLAVLGTIFVSALCGMFTIDVQATSAAQRPHAPVAQCVADAAATAKAEEPRS